MTSTQDNNNNESDKATKLFDANKQKDNANNDSQKTILKYAKPIMWFALTCSISVTPVMMRMSFKTGDGEIRKDKFASPTVHFFSFLASIFLGQLISYLVYGMKGLKECFNWRTMLWLVPVSSGYALSEALALVGMSYCSPMWYAVIHKGRLILTCFMTRVFLRRQVTLLQWCICFVVTCFVLSFVFVKLAGGSQSGQSDTVFGMLMLILNITISVACSIYADWIYKKLSAPLTVQIACGRISASLASLIISCVFISSRGWWKYGFFGGPGGGWDGKVISLLFFNIFRDWLTCCNLLYLTAIWKALAAVVAIILTFVLDNLMEQTVPGAAQTAVILGMFFSVGTYTVAKKIEGEKCALEKKNKELEKQLALYQVTVNQPEPSDV